MKVGKWTKTRSGSTHSIIEVRSAKENKKKQKRKTAKLSRRMNRG
jgi:hypothetical protein